MTTSSSAFYAALVKQANQRNDEDVSMIFNHLRRLDVFERLHDAPLRSVCRTARLERHPSNHVLFRKGQLATCWYILLSGSVFMNKQVYLPIGCFGKRSNMNLRRMSDCIVISPSDMIVIDYPDVQRITVHLNNNNTSSTLATGSGSPHPMHSHHCQHHQQQPTTSSSSSAAAQPVATPFPATIAPSAANHHPHPHLHHPHPSSSSASPAPVSVVVDHTVVARRRSGGWIAEPVQQTPPTTGSGGSSKSGALQQQQQQAKHFHRQPQHQHQLATAKQLVFQHPHHHNHRFPAAPQPPTRSPQQQHQNGGGGSSQIPVPLISARVPSPAPNSTPVSVCSSPTKQMMAVGASGGAQTGMALAGCHQHTKSNSMSAEGAQSQQQQQNNHHQQNQRQIVDSAGYHFEIPFIRAKLPPSFAGQQVQQQQQRQMNQKQRQTEDSRGECFSPPRPPRATGFLHAMAGSNSLVQQKKGMFEELSGGHHQGQQPQSSTATQPEQQSHQQQSQTFAMKRKEEEQKQQQHSMEPTTSSAARANNFQRLSKVRLNMGRKTATGEDAKGCASNSNASSSSSVPSQQQQQQTVRIRRQSPQQQPAAGHQRHITVNGQPIGVGHHPSQRRQSTASSTTSAALTAGGDESEDYFAGLPETAVDSEDQEDEEEDGEGSCPSHDSFQELRDSVRECLEKAPESRSAEDLAVLIEFMTSLPAIAAMPMPIKRQLCMKIVFAVVPKRGTAIMQNGERIDAWSVVVNGTVEHVRANGHRTVYRVGDSFGVQPIAQAQYNDGEIRTLTDDCEFILVEHSDFYSIISTLSRHIEQENDNTGEVVREVERRVVDNQVELVVTKASADRLLLQLLMDEGDQQHQQLATTGASGAIPTQMDSRFVEDFLLMHRVFLPDSTVVVQQLIDWFQAEPRHRERVARIILIWLNNNFEDFESNDSDGRMAALLGQLDQLFADAKMFSHQSLMSITCSVKSQPRMITLTRSDRSEQLDFQLIGGGPSFSGIFVLSIKEGSAAEKSGLKKGDEIIDLNGHNLRHVGLAKAEDLLRESTHLSMTIKLNWIGFKEAQSQQHNPGEDQVDGSPAANIVDPIFRSAVGQQQQQQNAPCLLPSRFQKKCSVPTMVAMGQQKHPVQKRERRSTLSSALQQAELDHSKSAHFQLSGTGTMTPGSNATLSSKKMLNKLLYMIRGNGNNANATMGTGRDEAQKQHQLMVDSADEMALPLVAGGSLRASRSNPDISAHCVNALASCSSVSSSSSSHRHSSLCPATSSATSFSADQVLKVYRADQSFRFVPVSTETTAKQLVHLAMQEFGIDAPANEHWWAMYECSVSREGVTRQKRLPDSVNSLVETALNARLYLRDLQRPEESTLLPDELIPEVLKQARITLYTLNAQCMAIQLTLQDFAVFTTIEPSEYVNQLFDLCDDDDPCAIGRRRGWPHLAEFEALFNREMWWVTTEVCCERNIYRRSKLVKKFIKIARHCQILRNLNSMFAIISGLEKPAVRRLAHTWERVPGKYLRMLAELQQLMDPSRNMSRYRQHLALLSQDPPVIPIYPVLRKDLTFAHEANPTFCGPKLVNFEKLQMIAQMIRSIKRLSSVPYDAAELAAGAPNILSSTAELLEGTMRKGTAGNSATLIGGMSTMGWAGISHGGGGGARFGTSGGGNMSRKKLYERTLMLRRVKAYLQNTPVIDIEVELDRLSMDCEPPAALNTAGGISSSVQQLYHPQGSSASSRRRLPSPSPSSLSSQSNQSSSVHQQDHHRHRGGRMGGVIPLPKFGVESPQAVQKMLSLVHNSKIKISSKQYQQQTNPRIGGLLMNPGNASGGTAADLPPIGGVDLHQQFKKRSSMAEGSGADVETPNERAIL